MGFGITSPYGRPGVDSAGAFVPESAPTLTALKAILDGDSRRNHGNTVRVDADGSSWTWHSTSVLTADDILVASAADVATVTAGRWLRTAGPVALRLPFTFATADGATLLTIPTGCVLKADAFLWEITADMTGGSSSAIGVAGTGSATAGDLIGGAGGDVAAALTAGTRPGTIGPKMDSIAEINAQVFVATNTITFERITSAFTAGSGYVVLIGRLLKHPGA